jgi:hypothetical protein
MSSSGLCHCVVCRVVTVPVELAASNFTSMLKMEAAFPVKHHLLPTGLRDVMTMKTVTYNKKHESTKRDLVVSACC